jgi:TPR repeat protein
MKYARAARVITPAMEALKEKKQQVLVNIRQKTFESEPAYTNMQPRGKAMLCRSNIEVGTRVTDKQARFMAAWFIKLDSINVGNALEDALVMSSATLDDVFNLALILRKHGSVDCAKRGRTLVKSCADAGHVEATIQVVASALRQDISAPGVLRSAEVSRALSRLRDFSIKGHVRAVVVEAHVVKQLHNTTQAISLYERALDLLANRDESNITDEYEKKADEFSSPWIELAYLYISRSEMVKAVKAYTVGTDKGDPMAHFHLARLDHHMEGQYTPDWLYNMTKAAASGHYRAAFDLGEYYANTAAPAQPPNPSFSTTMQQFGAFLLKPSLDIDPRANITKHDALADTPRKRIELAYQWLASCRSQYYLPANTLLAQLHLQRYIYPTNTLLRPLSTELDHKEQGAVLNHRFHPGKAQILLAEVFTGCAVLLEAKAKCKDNRSYMHMTQPWSKHEEVLEALQHNTTLQELQNHAETIAEAAGIDIYSSREMLDGIPKFGILRLHKGTHRPRGKGLCELPPDQITRHRHDPTRQEQDQRAQRLDPKEQG